MNRGIYILLHQTLGKQNRVLIVVSFPGHKPNQRILAQSNLAVLGTWSVGNHISCLHMIPFIHNRLLVVTVGLVASLKLCQMVNLPVPIVIPADNDLIAGRALYHTCMAGQHTDT